MKNGSKTGKRHFGGFGAGFGAGSGGGSGAEFGAGIAKGFEADFGNDFGEKCIGGGIAALQLGLGGEGGLWRGGGGILGWDGVLRFTGWDWGAVTTKGF